MLVSLTRHVAELQPGDIDSGHLLRRAGACMSPCLIHEGGDVDAGAELLYPVLYLQLYGIHLPA